jgi:2,3-bisphosphoglycerate-independent phosphoglycerate mutase
MAFVMPNFENLEGQGFGATFKREKVSKNVFFVTMTQYKENLPVSGIAFGPEAVDTPLGAVLASSGFRQMRMAESEKERFVTYYFNGFREEKFEGEEVKIIPSPKVPTYDRKPEMSLPGLVNEFKKQIGKDLYHFTAINFANPDMVAHSGNLQATVRAVEYVDRYVSELVNSVLAIDGTVIITADHGNAEELITFPSATFFFTTSRGTVNTDHSNNPVPVFIINNAYKGSPILLEKGFLGDIAPTILNLMGIAVPEVMTGRNLLARSR